MQGTDWSGTIKVGNFAQWGLSYIQSVSKNLALGVDITYLGKPPFNQVRFILPCWFCAVMLL
jgi:hypothetical protein